MEDNIFDKKIPRLFKKALNTLKEKEDNSKITEEYVSIVNDNIIENEKFLSKAQNIVLSKIMLYLISFCNNKTQTPSENLKKLKEFYEKKFEDNLRKDDIFKEITKDNDKNLENIILTILKYFLKNLNKKQISKNLKKKWEDLKLHLENFEINNTINKALLSYLEQLKKDENNYCKEFLDILISQLNSGNNSQIIKYIYYFINYKIKEGNQIIYMKDLADKERENNEYKIEINPNNTNSKNSIFGTNNEKPPPKNYIIDVFKKWTIEINLNEKKINPEIFFGFENITDKYYEEYNDENEDYNKKFKRYIEFKNKIIKYIQEEKNNIKLKTKILLEITPIKDDNIQIFDDKKFYEFHNIQCISSYEYERKKFEFKDKNILSNGINGKSPGFIYMINELCNDEYIIKENK